MRPKPLQERCELCETLLAPEHAHLADLSGRRLVCACAACALLFDHQSATRYRRVPRRLEVLADFQLTDQAWDALGLPIRLAFFLHNTALGQIVAVFPGPAGATETLVTLDHWGPLVQANPSLRGMQPDVEALLVNRVGAAREHYLVGIDHCYKLVGLLRAHWSGLSGAAKVWEVIGEFFATLKAAGAPRAVTS